MRFLLLLCGLLFAACTDFGTERTFFELPDQFIEFEMNDGQAFHYTGLVGAQNESKLLYHPVEPSTEITLIRYERDSDDGRSGTLTCQLPLQPQYLDADTLFQTDALAFPLTIEDAAFQLRGFLLREDFDLNLASNRRNEVSWPVIVTLDGWEDHILRGTFRPHPDAVGSDPGVLRGSFRLFTQAERL